jgi:HEAT repeat protein
MQGRNLWVLGVVLTLVLGGQGLAAPAAGGQDVPPRLQGLFAALEDPNLMVSTLALEFLVKEELDTPGVRERVRAFARTPRMGELLDSKEWAIRQSALVSLEVAGEDARPHLPRLAELLRDPRPEVRGSAVETVAELGPVASSLFPLLLELVQDEGWGVQMAVGEALAKRGAVADPQVLFLLGRLQDTDAKVRRSALTVLGLMGPAASAHAPRVAEFLQDKEVQLTAFEALGRLGPGAGAQAPRVAGFLKDPDMLLRRNAVRALGHLGAGASDYVPLLTELARKESEGVQIQALEALGNLGPVARASAPLLLELVEDTSREEDVREAAAGALGKVGARSFVPRLLELLVADDYKTAVLAARALAQMGESEPTLVPALAGLLDHPERVRVLRVLQAMGGAASEAAPRVAALLQEPDGFSYRNALETLTSMGPKASGQAPLVAALLEGEHRGRAVETLGWMGPGASAQAPLVAALLHDEDERVRLAAVRALSEMGPGARPQVQLLLELAQEQSTELNTAVWRALLRHGEPGPDAVAAILAATLDASALGRSPWLMLAHGLGGGEPDMERLVRWVGRSPEELPSELSVEEARAVLEAFAAFWPRTEKYPKLRKELARQVAEVASLARGRWERADLALLQQHERNLSGLHPTQAETLGGVIASLERWRVLRGFGWGWTVHAAFWLVLLFVYPRSPQVQAVFFWNPWVRRITGFGYVGLLLTWVPFFRRRLLSPFGPLLLAEARLEGFSASAYFDRAEVLRSGSAQREPLLRVLPRVRGQLVLEGNSGLGKSMFLKYLLTTSERLAVYLPAERCKDGVLEAIQAKLEGQAKDATLLRSLIYSGGLDIYIDGLNEVTADTRARIVQFVERNLHGNILLTTQPIEWAPPVTAKRYVLQPLTEEQVARFLESREPVLGEKARVRGQAYLLACQRFVAEALSAEQPVELRQANAEVLSNPMDLTVVAQMLADEQQPHLFQLGQQQYALMAKEYQDIHRADFPLKELSEEAYSMRCEDRSAIPEERFGRELLRMEAAKMVLRQQWKGPDGKEVREWRFRHDKVQEFFIAQTFLGQEDARAAEHLKDPRFRGVYLLLALLLEPEQGRTLCDMLVEYAAETRDHSVSDDFVTLLKKRQRAEKARATRARRAAAKEA